MLPHKLNCDCKFCKIERLKEINADLLEALELNMKWIGPPPTDQYSYDSLREDAWKKGKQAIAKAKE